MLRIIPGLLGLLSLASLCRADHQSAPTGWSWDEARVRADLSFIAAEPHPMGSQRQVAIADYIEQEMKKAGLTSRRDSFEAEVPDPELLGETVSAMRKPTLTLSMQNVQVSYGSPDLPCVFLLGSHYDSKRLEGGGIGANDSGSSSAALMELMRRFAEEKPGFRCQILAVWFDGEEAYLPNWSDGETRHPAQQEDHLYGSRHMASQLQPCGTRQCLPGVWGGQAVEGMILLDMIGMPDLKISQDSYSTPALLELALTIDKEQFGGRLFASGKRGIEDDHIPFLQKGIPALDLIGFEDTSTWHQLSDTSDRISFESMKQASQLTNAMLDRLIKP